MEDELQVWIEAIRQMQWMGAKINEIQVDKETILRLASAMSMRDRMGTSNPPNPKTWYAFPALQIHGVSIIEKSVANKPAAYQVWDD